MRPRLLITDLDGTLLDEHGQPHEADCRAIAALRAGGVTVSIATGRLYSGTRGVAERLGLDGPVGCLDGSSVVCATSHRELEGHPIPSTEVAALMTALAAQGAAAYVLAGDRVFHDARGEEYLHYVHTWSRATHRVERVHDHPWHEGPDPGVVVAIADEAAIGAVGRALAGRELFVAQFPLRRAGLEGRWGMITRRRGTSKATAVAAIARHHGVALAETVVVGDWVNDVPMFEVAGRAFAMGQAPPEVRAAATDVLDADSQRGGGIAEAARRCGLL